MKISGSFITMLLIWILGFTHILGGPYLLFKIIFWLALLPFFIVTFFLIMLLLSAKKLMNSKDQFTSEETIHVEATIKE